MPTKKRDLVSALPFGADLELRGPPENKLFELDHIYNRNEYPTVHALADEWSIVDERYQKKNSIYTNNSIQVFFFSLH